MKHQGILILDYGSQYTQLIARRIREAHVFCEIHPPDRSLDWIREWQPRGVRRVYRSAITRSAQGGYGTFKPPQILWAAATT